jgi:hypothetical protein
MPVGEYFCAHLLVEGDRPFSRPKRSRCSSHNCACRPVNCSGRSSKSNSGLDVNFAVSSITFGTTKISKQPRRPMILTGAHINAHKLHILTARSQPFQILILRHLISNKRRRLLKVIFRKSIQPRSQRLQTGTRNFEMRRLLLNVIFAPHHRFSVILGEGLGRSPLICL